MAVPSRVHHPGCVTCCVRPHCAVRASVHSSRVATMFSAVLIRSHTGSETVSCPRSLQRWASCCGRVATPCPSSWLTFTSPKITHALRASIVGCTRTGKARTSTHTETTKIPAHNTPTSATRADATPAATDPRTRASSQRHGTRLIRASTHTNQTQSEMTNAREERAKKQRKRHARTQTPGATVGA